MPKTAVTEKLREPDVQAVYERVPLRFIMANYGQVVLKVSASGSCSTFG